jgi:hypothetical protein
MRPATNLPPVTIKHRRSNPSRDQHWSRLLPVPTMAVVSDLNGTLSKKIKFIWVNWYPILPKQIIETMDRLDQGHLHPNLEVPGLTCPGRESNPGREASTLEKSHPDSLLMAIQKIYIWASDVAPPSACVTWTYVNTPELHQDVGQIALARWMACCLADALQVRVFRMTSGSPL